MIRKLEKYKASARPYLLRPRSYYYVVSDDGWTTGKVEALWFRRKNGIRVAAFGFLSDPVKAHTYEEFLKQFKYGRYGATCTATWDGEKLWTPTARTSEDRKAITKVLKPALASFPEIPKGWDGWYDIREDWQIR